MKKCYENIIQGKKIFWYLFVPFFISYFQVLFNDGLFWDDWFIANRDLAFQSEFFRMIGHFQGWLGYWFSFIFSFPSILSFQTGPIFQRWFSFITFFITGLILYKILKRVKEIDPFSRYFIVLIYLLFPIFIQRYFVIMADRIICYFFFFLALYVIDIYLNKKNILLRFLFYIFAFVSFGVHSIIPYYLIILIYVAYREKDSVLDYKSIIKRTIYWSDIIILPLIYWILKVLYFKPYGAYQGYNDVSFYKDIPQFLLNYWYFFENSLILPFFLFIHKIAFVGKFAFIVLFILIIIYYIYKKLIFNSNFILLLFGILAFSVGAFSYVAVNKTTSPTFFDMRHQVLLPLGAAFIIYYFFQITFHFLKIIESHKFIFFIIICFGFTLKNMKIYYTLQTDWYKQLSLMENFRTNDNIKNNHSFIFTDNTKHLNIFERHYSYYELAGMLRNVFKDASRLAITDREYRTGAFESTAKAKDQKVYSIWEYEPEKLPKYTIVVEEKKPLNFKMKLILFYERMFEQEKYKQNLSSILIVNTLKFKSDL